MRVQVFPGSVLASSADAVVNAANTDLVHGGGVARAIAHAAGPSLTAESRRIGHCPLGSAVATAAGNLAARVVVHVPTIQYGADARPASEAELRQSLHRALTLAVAHSCRSVALPLLGGGIVGLSPEASCRRIADALRTAVPPLPALVMICAFTPAEQAAARAVFGPEDDAGQV